MDANERDQVFRSGLDACRNRRFREASRKFRLLVADGSTNPRHLSFYGLTLARDRHNLREGIELCQRAIALAPHEPQLYLNLARAYSATGRQLRAVQVLRQGLRLARPHPSVQRELDRLSPRSKPVLPVLSRDHLLNKYLGRVRARLGRAG